MSVLVEVPLPVLLLGHLHEGVRVLLLHQEVLLLLVLLLLALLVVVHVGLLLLLLVALSSEGIIKSKLVVSSVTRFLMVEIIIGLFIIGALIVEDGVFSGSDLRRQIVEGVVRLLPVETQDVSVRCLHKGRLAHLQLEEALRCYLRVRACLMLAVVVSGHSQSLG